MKSLKVLLVSFFLLSTILTVSSFAQEAAERSEFKQEASNKGVARAVNPGEMRFDKSGVWIDDVSLTPEIASTNNYSFVTTTTGSLTDMSTGTTTLVGANLDDTASAVTNIGFDFWFQGVRFTQFSANSNGDVRLGGVAVQGGSPYQALAQAGISLLSPFSSDLRTHTTGRVHFKVIGAAPNRTLVIEWLNMQSNFNSGGTVDLTYQMRLSETTGVIEYAYGVMTMSAGGAADPNSNDPQIGFSSNNTANTVGSVTAAQSGAPPPTYNGTSAVPTNNLYVAGSIVALSGAADGSRRTFNFTSPVPTDPTGLNFTAVTAVGMTLNWTDASSNEAGFVIYNSTDGINYTFVQQAAENATSSAVTGLTPSTNYFWRVASVSEGALSAGFATGTQMTGAPGADSCLGAGGNWSAAGTWLDGTPPTGTDIVTIGAGCTVTIDSSNAFSVIVQSGGVLQFEATTARTLTVVSDVTIDAGGTFQSNPAGTQTAHVLSIGGNLTNNGTLDFSTNTDTAGAGITFTGAANNTFGGTGATTDVRTITINKGTSNANILELTTSAFTVRGAVVDSANAGYLTLTNGTFKISGTFTANFRTFPIAAYTIGATAGIWLNNPNYTVTAQNGSATNSGLLRLTQGTYNVGTGAGSTISGTTGVYNIEGGTFNVSGRFQLGSSANYTQSGGNLNCTTVGNTSASFAGYDALVGAVMNMSGGNINLVQRNTAATGFDYWVDGTINMSGTGTTLNVGTAATITAFNFRIRGNMPNVNVDNTTNAKTATFVAQSLIRGNQTIQIGTTYNLNGFLVAVVGGFGTSIVNNGTIVGSTAGSTWYFQNTSPMVVSGSGIQGTNAAPIVALSIDSTGGVDFATLVNNAILRRINLFTGSTTGSGKLTLGAGDAVVNIVQIGNATTATAAGNFDVPLTFNLGTGGQTIFYLRETGTRTTGNEVNPARTLVALTYDDNGVAKTLTIAGGNLLVTGAMTLTNGIILTGANILTHNGAATRTNGYVDGTLNRSYTATGAYTYFVGQNGYSPVLATVSALTTNPSQLSVQPFDATLGGFSPAQSISRNWLLTEVGDLTADISLTYLVADENGNEADYRVWRRDGAGLATDLCGAPCVNTGTNVAGPALGVTAFGRFTAAEALTPTAAAADISGRVLTAGGLPIANVRVILSGGQLPEPINVYTGHLGIYYFLDVPVGQNYVITVKSRRFFFAKPSHLFTLNDDLIDQDFVAEPQWPQ